MAGLALAQTPPASRPTPGADAGSSLNLTNEGNGWYAQMKDLFRFLDSRFAGAQAGWDPVRGIIRIQARGRRVDILARGASVILDGRLQAVPKPVLMKQDKVFIPAETVQIVLKHLGMDSEINVGASQPVATATPVAAATPIVISDAQAPTTGPAVALPPIQPAVVLPPTPARVEPELPSTPSLLKSLPAPTPLATPAATEQAEAASPRGAASSPAGRIGLSWAQLADANHRLPPKRLTLVCDGSLEPVARDAARQIQNATSLVVTVVLAPSQRRDQELLLARAAQERPDLLVDLMASPGADGQASQPLRVWIANDALWPEDRQAEDSASPGNAYRRHQFQSLALGSQLQTELASAFSDRVPIEMAPSLLLRRTDAPAAAILVPAWASASSGTEGSGQALAKAIATGVRAYQRGMEAAAR